MISFRFTIANLTLSFHSAKASVFILCCNNIKNLIKSFALSPAFTFCYMGFAKVLFLWCFHPEVELVGNMEHGIAW